MRSSILFAVLSFASVAISAPAIGVERRTQVTQCSQSTSLYCCTSSGQSASQGGIFGNIFGDGLFITCNAIPIAGGAVPAICPGGSTACCGQEMPEQTTNCGQYQFLSNDFDGNNLLYCIAG